MRVPHGLFLLAAALVLSPIARADTPVQIDKVTAYSPSCQYDKQGGGSSAANGERVQDHTVENPGGGYFIAAVPQSGGNAGIFGCFFTDPQLPGKRGKAADHYGTGSNGQLKADYAHECTPAVNNQSMPATTITVEGNCGSTQGGAGDKITRGT